MKPAALERKPKPKGSDAYYYNAFWMLSPSRPGGESFGAIPQSEYLAYWESYSIRGLAERERFQKMVGCLDQAFVKYTQDKRAKEVENLKNQSPSAKGGSRPQ